MLGSIKTVLSRIESRSADGIADVWPDRPRDGGQEEPDAADPVTDGGDPIESPQLYTCPSCDRVFVATEKETCLTCETAVDRVEATA